MRHQNDGRDDVLLGICLLVSSDLVFFAVFFATVRHVRLVAILDVFYA